MSSCAIAHLSRSLDRGYPLASGGCSLPHGPSPFLASPPALDPPLSLELVRSHYGRRDLELPYELLPRAASGPLVAVPLPLSAFHG